ncbi:MAG: outer membrane beta-barrel protein [Xanthobacteraceae bacterium]|jgi:outer membrane immunogenic protein
MIAPVRLLHKRRPDREGAAVRWFICAVVLLALTPRAFADDLDILRGTESVGAATFPRWSGFYFGGQVSYSDGSASFNNATQPLLAFSLRELALEEDVMPSAWPVLGSGTSSSTGFGGFVGYSTQWQDLILGLEANYTHSPFTVTAPDVPIGRVVAANGNLYSVNIDGTGTLNVTDFGSLRARAGWVFNNYLPYGFAGVALGRASYSVTTLIDGQQNAETAPSPVIPCDPAITPTCVDYSFSNSAGKTNTILYGFTVGGGVDVALTQNIFVRAEYEYIQFAPFASITAAISSVRVGAGLKF